MDKEKDQMSKAESQIKLFAETPVRAVWNDETEISN